MLWAQSDLPLEEVSARFAKVLGTEPFVPLPLPSAGIRRLQSTTESVSLEIIHFLRWDDLASTTAPCYWFFAWWDTVGREYNYLIFVRSRPDSLSRHQFRRLRRKLSDAIGAILLGNGNT